MIDNNNCFSMLLSISVIMNYIVSWTIAQPFNAIQVTLSAFQSKASYSATTIYTMAAAVPL